MPAEIVHINAVNPADYAFRPAAITKELLRISERVAQKRFPNSSWALTYTLKANETLPFTIMGLWDFNGTISIEVVDTPNKFCTIFTHEYGHSAGHTHEEGGVMAAEYDHAYGPCVKALRAYNWKRGY